MNKELEKALAKEKVQELEEGRKSHIVTPYESMAEEITELLENRHPDVLVIRDDRIFHIAIKDTGKKEIKRILINAKMSEEINAKVLKKQIAMLEEMENIPDEPELAGREKKAMPLHIREFVEKVEKGVKLFAVTDWRKTAEKACQELKKRYPGAAMAGIESRYYIAFTQRGRAEVKKRIEGTLEEKEARIRELEQNIRKIG